eukprot:COSAG01_NODE_26531_length_711_cov_0.830065_1_plen_96_part_10
MAASAEQAEAAITQPPRDHAPAAMPEPQAELFGPLSHQVDDPIPEDQPPPTRAKSGLESAAEAVKMMAAARLHTAEEKEEDDKFHAQEKFAAKEQF